MAKAKTIFFCKECGHESSKWLGQCPGCKEWNTFVEEPVVKKSVTGSVLRGQKAEPSKLSEVKITETARTMIGIGELDRVLGGGIVQGSLTLVGGDPGIGKSLMAIAFTGCAVDEDEFPKRETMRAVLSVAELASMIPSTPL